MALHPWSQLDSGSVGGSRKIARRRADREKKKANMLEEEDKTGKMVPWNNVDRDLRCC